jgi:hypothetical protein
MSKERSTTSPLRKTSPPKTTSPLRNRSKPSPSPPLKSANKKQINANVVRTVCINELPANRKNHLKGLLTSTPRVPYTQGDNFLALELLRLHPINDAYEIFKSNGIRRFRMLSLDDRMKFVKEVSPLFKIAGADSIHLSYVLLSFIHFLYVGSPNKNSSSCVSKLLTVLLSQDKEFYKDTHNFVQFYFFVLRHLSISVAEDFIATNQYQNINIGPDQKFINRIEDLTLTSINAMSINGRNALHNYHKNGKKYKFHILAAYAVMLLDKLFGVDLKINVSNILSELIHSQNLIHISQTPNLQGIRPILRQTSVIEFENNVPLKTILFAKTQTGVSKKLFVAQFILGLKPQKITRDTPLGQYFMKIMYVNKKEKRVLNLYEAIYARPTTLKKIQPMDNEQPPLNFN